MTASRLVRELIGEGQGTGKGVFAVLTPESQKALLAAFPPVHPDVKAHHLTMAYDPEPAVLERFARMEGQTIKMRVLGHAQDERGQAVAVYAPSMNLVPHVTISVASGTEAVYSNELLDRGWESDRRRLELEGVVTVEDL